jgi:DNA modification methylase
MNKLFYGDYLDVLPKFIRDETVDLCNIDPPLNSKRDYKQHYRSIGREDRTQRSRQRIFGFSLKAIDLTAPAVQNRKQADLFY